MDPGSSLRCVRDDPRFFTVPRGSPEQRLRVRRIPPQLVAIDGDAAKVADHRAGRIVLLDDRDSIHRHARYRCDNRVTRLMDSSPIELGGAPIVVSGDDMLG